MANNELSYKDYPDGTRAYFRDDVARGGGLSDINEQISAKITENFSSTPTKINGYLYTNGVTVDLSAFVTPVANPNALDWDCWIFPVVKGDSFRLTIKGGSAPRAWCFINENGIVISKANDSATLNDTTITATEKGFCIIHNNKVPSTGIVNPSIVGTLYTNDAGYQKASHACNGIDILSTSIKSVFLKNNESATIPSNWTDYYSMMCIGYIPGVGGVILGFRYHNGTSEVKDILHGGTDFTSSYITFTFNRSSITVTAGNYSPYKLTFISMPNYEL